MEESKPQKVLRRGSHRKRFTREEITQIETMASIGMNAEQISHVIGMSRANYYRIKKNQDELAEAIARGRSKGIQRIAATAYQMAASGEYPNMTMFWLKVRAGWIDKSVVETRSEVTFRTQIGPDGALRTAESAPVIFNPEDLGLEAPKQLSPNEETTIDITPE